MNDPFDLDTATLTKCQSYYHQVSTSSQAATLIGLTDTDAMAFLAGMTNLDGRYPWLNGVELIKWARNEGMVDPVSLLFTHEANIIYIVCHQAGFVVGLSKDPLRLKESIIATSGDNVAAEQVHLDELDKISQEMDNGE